MDMYFGTRSVISIIHIKGITVEIETQTKTKCNELLSKDVPSKIIQSTSLKRNIHGPKVDGKFFYLKNYAHPKIKINWYFLIKLVLYFFQHQ